MKPQSIEQYIDPVQLGLSTLPHPVIVFDRSARQLFANDAATEIVIARGSTSKQLQELVYEGLKTTEPFTRDFVFKTGRATRVYLATVSPILSRGGHFFGVTVSLQDTTVETQQIEILENRLLENEGYRRATEFFDVVSETDLKGRILFVNDRYCQLSKYSRQELVGHHHRVLTSKLHSPEFFKTMWSTILDGRVWSGEICNRARDGSLFWMSMVIAPVKTRDGQVQRFLSVGRDITQQKNLEGSLRESEHRFRELFENIDLLAIGLDLSGKIKFANRHFSEVTGWKTDEILDLDWFQAFVPVNEKDAVSRHFLTALSVADGHVQYESALTTKSGARKLISWHSTRFKNINGKVVGIAAIGEDITERRANESRVQELHQREEVLRQEVVAFVSHELRSPLMAINALVEKIEEQAVANQIPDLKCVKEQVRRIEHVSRDLLETFIYRSTELKFRFKEVNLNSLLKGVTDRFMQSKILSPHLQLKLDLPENEIVGHWDEDRLDQVFSNLISNAIKYSKPEGGLIQVRAYLKTTMICRIEIKDQGVGIPQECLESIFELFTRAPNVTSSPSEGMGIGLKIARDIVHRHNGEIFVSSRLNQGSTFWVDLPLVGH